MRTHVQRESASAARLNGTQFHYDTAKLHEWNTVNPKLELSGANSASGGSEIRQDANLRNESPEKSDGSAADESYLAMAGIEERKPRVRRWWQSHHATRTRAARAQHTRIPLAGHSALAGRECECGGRRVRSSEHRNACRSVHLPRGTAVGSVSTAAPRPSPSPPPTPPSPDVTLSERPIDSVDSSFPV